MPVDGTTRALNTAPDNPRETIFAFELTAWSATEVQRLDLDFESAGSGGVQDANGVYTGFPARLLDTGGALPVSDPNLELDTAAGTLKLRSTQADFFGGAGLEANSMPGVSLADFGFAGNEDFAITANFHPLPGLEFIDQVGLYVGTGSNAVTRAGTIVFGAPEYISVHSRNGVDFDGRFFGFGFDPSDGMDVTITRESGQWSYYIDGVEWNPLSQPAFLDGEAGLVAGVFAMTPLNGNAKTVGVDAFSAVIDTGEPWLSEYEQWRVIHFAQLEATGIAGDNEDPDNDGRTNEQEFEDGTDPLVAD